MTININRYVDINSVVGAGINVPVRALTGRMFTNNPLLPPDTYVEFDSAAAVSSFFGSTSEEALRAAFYFSWISKSVTQPEFIQFARWVNADVEPLIYSVNGNATQLASWTAISNGSFGLTINGVVNAFTATDFSAAVSLAGVAAILQTKIRTASGTMWTAATVTYNVTRGGFDFTGGDAVEADISVQPGVGGTDISGTGLLGWFPGATFTGGVFTNGAIWASGALEQTLTEVLDASANVSNNFGSFLFLNNLALTQADVVEAATWNYDQNNMFMYTVGVSVANATAWATALAEIGGVALTLSPTYSPAQYPEQIPMMVAAATNYADVNSVQNYMFQTNFTGITPSVTTDAAADGYDAIRVNYYGSTQTAGTIINFYQRGVLQGPATSPIDMTAYVNEIWLKDACSAAIMNIFLLLNQLPANAQGRAQILTTLQAVINQALINGTISVNKALTIPQQMFITAATGDDKAWYQVQTIGYWVDCEIVPVGSNPVTYTADYTLVYSKDDVIRLVNGTDILI